MHTRLIRSTRLNVPGGVRTLIPRTALLDRLDDPDWQVAVFAAPAGFGKTTVLASWAGRHPDRTAWLSCDAADREPLRFWTGVVTALSTRWPGVGGDALEVLSRAGAERHDAVVDIADDLADLDEPVTLILDDLHLAGPQPSVLAAFVAALPPSARLVLAGRHVPPFSLAKLRVAGKLLEVYSDDLRFSPAESAALIEQTVELSDDELDRLHLLTEGWPAAVQMSAMSVSRRPDRWRFLDALAATDQALTDFLVSEVLAGLPADWTEFISTTAVLDEFDAELCNELTGRDDAGALLQQLLAAGLFVIPLDATGEWFRYHHLFGSFMRARVRAHGVRRFRDLNRRASRALEARGMTVSAIRHAFANDDAELAAAIVRRSFTEAMLPVDVEVCSAAARQWLHEHGAHAVTANPSLLLEMLAALLMITNGDDVGRWLVRVADAHPDAEPQVAARLHGVWAEHELVRGRGEAALERVEMAMHAIGSAPPLGGVLQLLHPVRIRARLAIGDFDGARRAADEALSRSTGNDVLDRARLPALRAWIASLDGDLEHADTLAAEVLRQADLLRIGDNEPARVYVWLARTAVHLERMEDEEATHALDRANHVADALARPPLSLVVTLARAMLARLTGDADGAETHLAVAQAQTPQAATALRTEFRLEAARQAVRFEPWAAESKIEALGHHPAATALRARWALAQGRRTDAADAVGRLPAPTTRRQRVELAMFKALLAPGIDEARDDLLDAIQHAAPDRLRRTVVEAGPDVAQLLQALPSGPYDAYVTSLIAAAAATVAPPRRASDNLALTEPLSPSELNVLRYLSSRLTNREIAEALYVSINTLKTHVKSIYRKLDVSSRAEAVSAGRAARLI